MPYYGRGKKNLMKLTISKKIKFVKNDDASIVFVPGPVFAYSDYLFVFGDIGIDQVATFCNKLQKVYNEVDCDYWLDIFKDDGIQNLILKGNGLCTEPMNSAGGLVYVPDRSDALSVTYHEIIHLVDYVIKLNGVSDDTEVRAFLFQYYEQAIAEARA